MAARHWPLTRFSLGSTPRNNGPRGDCQRHREEHRYRSQVTSIRSSERGRQPQKRQCNQPCARANDVENHLDARPGKDETGDCYSAQTDHVARDYNGEVVVDQYLSVAGGAPQLRSAMADWYRAHAGGFVTTAGLEQHLVKRAPGVAPLFRRYVRGLD